MFNHFNIIKYVKLDNCPPNQLTRANNSDAGWDLSTAEDVLILPFSLMPFEWEELDKVENINPKIIEQVKEFNEADNYFNITNNILFRRKYKFEYVSTGIKIQAEDLMWLGLYPRSGSSSKYNVGLTNSVGIIDYSYHKEIKVALYAQHSPVVFKKGERIAQLVPSHQKNVGFNQITEEEFSQKESNRGGFGSSGMFEVPNIF